MPQNSTLWHEKFKTGMWETCQWEGGNSKALCYGEKNDDDS